jgi:hypothetical protein
VCSNTAAVCAAASSSLRCRQACVFAAAAGSEVQQLRQPGLHMCRAVRYVTRAKHQLTLHIVLMLVNLAGCASTAAQLCKLQLQHLVAGVLLVATTC